MTFLCCCYPSVSNTKSNKIKVDDLGSFAINSIEDEVYTGPKSSSTPFKTSVGSTKANNVNDKDFEDLEHIARKREIRITIRRGTQAGVAAGLSVMAGVIMAGPVGAVVGGAVGTAVAHRMSKNVISLQDLLHATPMTKRKEILHVFQESFKEEFIDSIQNNPELRLLMSGTSIFGVMRYMVDREMLQDDQLVRLDGILRKVF
jgi:hypothetical protein